MAGLKNWGNTWPWSAGAGAGAGAAAGGAAGVVCWGGWKEQVQ